MEQMKFNAYEHPSNEIGDSIMESGHYSNQVSKNPNAPSQIQHANIQFSSPPAHYSRQIDPPVPQPPGLFKPSIITNYLSSTPTRHQSAVNNMPFQNSNNHFRPYPPTLHSPTSVSSSLPLPTSMSSTQNPHRLLFSTPLHSVIPSGNMDLMQFGQLKFPPPIPASVPYFSNGYAKNASSFSNNHSQQYLNNSVQTILPGVSNMVPSQYSSYQPSTMSQIISSLQSTITVPDNTMEILEKINLLNNFLQKFNLKEKKEAKSDITVAEFRYNLKKCFSLFNLLQSSRENLVSFLDSTQEKWEVELKQVKELQDKLSEACSVLLFANYLPTVQRKLKAIKKKRALKKKLKGTLLEQRAKKEQERERLHQEIDKWLDNLKEKNEKMKRELEMKKEADIILAEVRRKIHEAKKTIEKLKVFEKLRFARQTNSVQKGLCLQPDHSAKFEAKISCLREMMLAQLSNYEQEEKALQVMLETEQEDRREEEALWRKRKLMSFQQKKQKIILASLFGDFEEPAPDNPLYLFYQYQNSGKKSIENLVQIRHQWDAHLSEEGESIPLQWVVPVPPSSSSWKGYFTT